MYLSIDKTLRKLTYALWLLSGLAHADKLSLEQAIHLANINNPELQALQHQSEAAAAQIPIAGALPDPKAQFTYFGESVETRTGPQEAIYSLSQTIPWLTKLHTRTALASYDADSIARIHEAGQRRIEEAVTTSYTDLAYYTEAVNSTRANLQWLEDSRAIVEEQVRAGASLNALLRLEVEMERSRDRLDQFKQQQFAQRARLSALTGIDPQQLENLAKTDLPAPHHTPRSQLHSALIQHNPELHMLKSRIQSRQAQTELSKLDRYPDITLGINYIQVGNQSTARDAGRDPWNLSLAVNLPIWEGKNRAAIQSAQSVERAAMAHYYNRLQQLKAELSATLAQHADSLSRIQRYREKLIPLAEQALENSRAAYQSGQIELLEIIDSQRALLGLQLSQQRAIADALQAEARIKRLIGNSHPQQPTGQTHVPNDQPAPAKQG
ncbi:TolC family protein [Coraliomargarita sp. SDUM461004]|uniref:TolC family protein n=1 Tax=Thalassobacterium sedimentorum TaxID=3041258 RepID=A0ABU1AM70_9BACT|nr:TolC family protein [Coraliomargarita sp. SDUM461004]MDQ8195894.1 TolC family protein [Coraliomargarita sp. SDUM461004]